MRMPDPTEIEVLGEILVAESRRHQAYDVHAGHAAVTLEFFRGFARAHVLGPQPRKVGDDEAQPMRLFQVRDLSGDAGSSIGCPSGDESALRSLPAPSRSGSKGGPRR
jgi:hypothetical protein